MRLRYVIAILLLCGSAFAACSGSSPTWTAASPSATDIQACINAASAGDTINIPAGSASWGASALTLKAGGNTFVGATVVTCSGTPGTSGYSCSATDNTNITLTSDQSINATLTSGITIFKNFTFIDGSGGAGHGLIELDESFGMVGVRMAYNHFKMAVSGSVNLTISGYGLVDHNFFEDTTPSGGGAVPLNVYNYWPNYGYDAWNAATQLGSNQALVVEANYYTTSHTNSEGFFDGYDGCRVVVRFNTMKGNLLGGFHGTDSGAPDRSGMLVEAYQNYFLNPFSGGLLGSRGGITMFWSNTVPSDGAGTPSVSLNYVRYGAQISSASGWGEAGAGLNWINRAAPPMSGWASTPVTLNASNYQTSHTYAALSVVVDTNGTCNLQTIAGGTTGNAQPACPGTFGGTVTDNGGVVWVNVGGSTTASGLSVHGWCAANPDTAAGSDATCNALSPGDTASYYLDGPTPGALPCGYRDQPGCGHNQALTPNIEWSNTGAGLPSPVFSTTNSSIILQNTHYFDDNGACGSNATTGVCEGTSAPASCTTGVYYWNTSQGSWNSSGYGGQGVLYKCTSTNTWSLYYTPYTYPHPLEGSTTTTWSLVQSVANSSLGSFGGTCSALSMTCTMTHAAVTPGDVGVVTFEEQGSGVGGCASQVTITGVSGGGGGASYVLPVSAQCYNGVSGAHSANIGYLLSTTTADTSTTITRSGISGCNYAVSFREFRPPTGATLGVDAVGCQATGSGTSYPGVTLSLAGSNDAIVQAFSGGAGILSITSPYNSDLTSYDHDGSASSINTASGTAPTITTTQAATAEAAAIAFFATIGQAATPICSPGTGTYSQSQFPTCSTATSPAIMCYTTNGTTPATDGTGVNCTTGTLYSGAITINLTTTLKVIAGSASYTDSLVATYVYTLTSPYANVSPSTLTFSGQAVGSTSPLQNVTFSNVGAAGLLVTNVGVTGDFAESDNCPRVNPMGQGQSCLISVTFTPSASGSRTGTLTITDNSTGVPGTTQTVSLSGTGLNVATPGMKLKGNITLKGIMTLQGGQSGGGGGGGGGGFLTYSARTDAAVFGTGVTNELLPAACGGVPACLANAYNASASTGHQGAALSYTGSVTVAPPNAGTSVSGTNINGLNAYLNGLNKVMTDPDFGSTIVRASEFQLSTNVGCLGGASWGYGATMGSNGNAGFWASDSSKFIVIPWNKPPTVMAFNPTTGVVTPTALCGGYMPGATTFSPTNPHLVYTSVIDQENTVQYSSSSGGFITGETVTNGSISATLQAYNTGFVQLGTAVGSSYSGSVWTGATSGATFTAVSNPPSGTSLSNSKAVTPYANTIYQGVICDGTGSEPLESVCTKNPNGGSCIANDTTPACWYVIWTLVFNFNYLPAMAGDSHFPASQNNCLPQNYGANYDGNMAISDDSNVISIDYSDNGQSNHNGYITTPATTCSGALGAGQAGNSGTHVCTGPIYYASWTRGSGCRMLNTMTDTITADWGTTGAMYNGQSNDITISAVTATLPTPGHIMIQDTTLAETQLTYLADSNGQAITSGWQGGFTGYVKAVTGLIYTKGGVSADSSHVWRDCGTAPTSYGSCSGTIYITPSAAPTASVFYYPDVMHDALQQPNPQISKFSMVQQPDMKINRICHQGSSTDCSSYVTGGFTITTGQTVIVYNNNATYSPTQQFWFQTLAGTHDGYLACTSAQQCPKWVSVAGGQGSSSCSSAPYCSIIITDTVGASAGYNDTESPTTATMTPAGQDWAVGGYVGENNWYSGSNVTNPSLFVGGHSATGYKGQALGKQYWYVSYLNPSTPATTDGTPNGLVYGPDANLSNAQTPPPNANFVPLLAIPLADGQHGSWGDPGTQDLTVPVLFTTNVCGQALSGAGAFACPTTFTSVFDSEVVGMENWVTRSSPGSLIGADCNYSNGGANCFYRFNHTFNTNDNWAFAGQNAIGNCDPSGVWCVFPSDWNKTLGCSDGTTNCWSSWQASAPNASGTNTAWAVDGSGNVTITMSNSFCPTGGTQSWPAGGTISCGSRAGWVTLSGFAESWLNATLTLGANTGNAWGCSSGTCTAFVGTISGICPTHCPSSGTESSGTQQAVIPGSGSTTPYQRTDIFLVKLTTAHQ